MMGLLAALFTEPIYLAGWARLSMLVPLCLSMAVVYKALKSEDLRRLPLACLALWATMVGGMLLVGVVLLVGYELTR
jgi:hypothetical protein